MSNLTIILRSMKSYKKRNILILIQLSVSFLCLVAGLAIIDGTEKYKKDILSLTTLDTLKLKQNGKVSLATQDGLKDFYSFLKNDDRVANIGTYFVQEGKMEKYDKKIKIVFIDDSFSNMHKFTLSEGRNFMKVDYSNDTVVPILVGNGLKKYFKINENYENTFLSDKKAKILQPVGVLSSSNYFWKSGSSNLIDSISDMENTIVVPMNDEFDDLTCLRMRLESNMLLKLKDSKEKNNISDSIKKEALKINFESIDGVIDINSLIVELDNFTKVQRYFLVTFSILLFILSALGLVGTILYSINHRKKEFGIRYSLGATQSDLYYQVFGEILILYIKPNIPILAFVYILSFFIKELFPIYVGLKTAVTSLFIGLILSVVTSLLPIRYISKLEPIDLIRNPLA